MRFPVLEPESHTYYLDNLIVPGVTSVIDPLTDYERVPAAVLEYKSELGRAVHLATELYDKDDLIMESVDPVIKPYLDAWIRFRNETGFIIELNEHVVFHQKYFYAGTLDRVGLLNNTRSVIDIKTVTTLGPHTGVQLAAYQEAENSRRPKRRYITNRFALQLRPDTTYRLQPYNNKTDLRVFLSLLTIQNWRLQHDREYGREHHD